MNNRIKVAWICNFSNKEIQKIIHPGTVQFEYGPWITNLAKLFESEKKTDIHIISQNNFVTNYITFKFNNITYHFFYPYIRVFGKSFNIWHSDYKTNFFVLKKRIKKILNKIKPDIIHLHGTEVDHSNSIFQFKDRYPILISIQGFISASKRKDKYSQKRIHTEIKILKEFKHFGISTQNAGKYILMYNPNSFLHWTPYPLPDLKPINSRKEFDIVFFARLTKDKGIEDLLHAVKLIKKSIPNVKLCVIGGRNLRYLNYLKDFSKILGIEKNIFWAGFLNYFEDVYKLASKAKVSVLPTYYDMISGTILESMLMKLPVVAYDVGSINEINKEGECVTLVRKSDVQALAKEIVKLLTDEKLYLDRQEKSYNIVKKMKDNEDIKSNFLKVYNSIINEFHER